LALAPTETGIGIRRHFTTPDVHPYDEVEWEHRDARITNFRDGSVAFEQLDVEFPTTWSLNATNIVAQKYFRGTPGTAERESSLRQVIDRVVDTIADWGDEGGYFTDTAEADAFRAELKHLMVTQKAAFNSPVWFNIGVPGVPAQASACFILSVDDTMDSILNWYVEEGTIFKGGSGSGINLSRIRSSAELLKGGGTASGPVSFMRGADASAGTIKSGGKTRRAAKMVILDVDHPDVEEFIWCKAREEQKARVLRDAGFEMDLDGRDAYSIQYQNANNSVRVTDEFMQAVEADADWHLRAVTTGEVVKTVRARDLMRQFAQATWECADPGMQFDTTINRWHTAATTGRINGSNPCCFVGETLVDTADGPVTFEMLHKMRDAGDELPLAHSFDQGTGRFVLRPVGNVWIAGHTNQLVEVSTVRGLSLRCTPEHRFLAASGEYVEAHKLTPGVALCTLDDAAVTDAVRSVRLLDLEAPVPVYDLEMAGTHNFTVTADGPTTDHAVVVHNSEYMHLDNSACNLASINLLEFLGDDDVFDVDGYRQAIEVVFTAQEILVGRADYPTEPIGANARKFRQLGLGYANLGATLMALGMPYDSDAGRAWAGALTALMTGHAYATSARTAARMAPFAGYADNAEHMLRVLDMHRDEAAHIDEELVPAALLGAAQQAWDEACELGAEFGVRNSQSTVLAPTGTIGLMMDCDTTGIEPDLGLCKMKKLVGGGTMTIVNQTVPRALKNLGYSPGQIDEIVAWIDDNKTILGAPHVASEHLPVFACSMGDNAIHYGGHVRMMGAVQPFISGAISKCVVGDTLLSSADGLVRMSSLRQDEAPDTFRAHVCEVASLAGTQKTDAFYYGGVRPVHDVVLRSGHRVTATPNHRLLTAGFGGLTWKRVDELAVGDEVAVSYGAELWSPLPARFDDFVPSASYGCQKVIRVPSEMTEELAWLLGAFAAEGHVSRSNWTVHITNSEPVVRARAVKAWRDLFGVEARIIDDGVRCPSVMVASKTVVELLEHLGCGHRASEKRIPDAVLLSPRSMVLAFLQGLSLDAYVSVATMPKWAICLDAGRLLDDLQAVLTNLGVVHGRVSKWNAEYAKSYDEVYACGQHAQHLARLVPFMEPSKAAVAAELDARTFSGRHNGADVVPGISGADLYHLLPEGRSGRNGHGVRAEFGFLLDQRTRSASRATLERVASVPGVVLPPWLRTVLDDNLHFSPVESSLYGGEREVFDVSVPATEAFVGNGIVNHNTVNMPEDVSVEDVEQIHIDAWKLGVKAVAIYRDNCKVAQPLAMAKKGDKAGVALAPTDVVTQVVEKIVEKVVKVPVREKLPRSRASRTFEFRVADCKGFVNVGEYADGRPGEVFLRVSKQGSTLAGIMDSFAIAVSHGLQYGVPLRSFVEAFTNMRFEPAGMTDDPEIRIASSVLDYIFRRLAVDYLSYEERAELGILTVAERTQPTLPGVEETITENRQGSDVPADPKSVPSASELAASMEDADVALPAVPVPESGFQHRDAPYCMQCGVQMVRAGSCHACPSCGSTSGCS